MSNPSTRTFSCEFFPPKTPEGEAKLRATQARLAADMQPAFFSVTFGAGGSTQQGTLETVQWIQQTGAHAAPHLSCIGATRASIRTILAQYKANGVRRIVALRGDLPSGYGEAGEFRYAADLVAFIRQETGDWFHLEVAAYPEFHPQARTAQDDLRAFAEKVKAGADSAITQFFFNADAYFRFCDDAQRLGVNVPIVAGIMPLTNYTQIKRFCEKSAIDMPRWIEERLRGYGDDAASIRAFGLDVVADLCEQLLSVDAPGIHFYTMNQADATLELWRRISG